MTTNLLESFNHVLKSACAKPISALLQLIFYRCNSYWIKQRREIKDFIQLGRICPSSIQV